MSTVNLVLNFKKVENHGKQNDIYLYNNYTKLIIKYKKMVKTMVNDYTLTIHGITNMPNLSATDKLVMIHLMTLKAMRINESHVVSSSEQLGYTRHGYLKILKRLIEHGYVRQIKRGLYQLNETNIF